MPGVTSAILGSFGRPPLLRRVYLALRLRQGGYEGVAELLPRDGTILDLGAGEGLLAQLLARSRPGLRVVAVEADPERARRAATAAAGLAIRIVTARMEEAALLPADGVVLLDVLHYLPGPAQERLLARAAGVLRPGGLLLLRDPDPSAGLRFALAAAHARVFLRFGLTRGGRGRYRSGREWAGLLGELGLRADVRPLSPRSPYADRIVTGRRP